MTREEIFAIWAPADALWSPWVKPVLFAHLNERREEDQTAAPPIPGWPERADEGTAIVVDLPGATSVAVGLVLAERGYRPVPLFNAVPGSIVAARVEVWPIVHEISRGTSRLAVMQLAPGAPPAFLLDAGRRGGVRTGLEMEFDNRSVSFPTDFPSARFLRDHGIVRAVLLHQSTAPQPDLAHTLREWQRSGIALAHALPGDDGPPQTLHVGRPKLLGWVWYRALTLIRARPNPLGGYGGWVQAAGG